MTQELAREAEHRANFAQSRLTAASGVVADVVGNAANATQKIASVLEDNAGGAGELAKLGTEKAGEAAMRLQQKAKKKLSAVHDVAHKGAEKTEKLLTSAEEKADKIGTKVSEKADKKADKNIGKEIVEATGVAGAAHAAHSAHSAHAKKRTCPLKRLKKCSRKAARKSDALAPTLMPLLYTAASVLTTYLKKRRH